ncbi:IS3 family transposase [Streptomyces sp. NPDC056831]|uniref:IS3 family transposase n=1 Tax=Streptomyces sp. NPDC056831 TaxID=3345954 RepID=UPI0036D02779
MAERIKAVHDGTYGSPRITAELRDDDVRINEKKVARVMRKFSIVEVHLRKKIRTTVPEPSNQTVPDPVPVYWRWTPTVPVHFFTSPVSSTTSTAWSSCRCFTT